MVEGELEKASDPLIQPHLIKRLKERPRLIDFGFRKDVLDQMETNIAQRRTPDNMANNAVSEMFNQLRDSAKPVVEERVKQKAERVNETILQDK